MLKLISLPTAIRSLYFFCLLVALPAGAQVDSSVASEDLAVVHERIYKQALSTDQQVNNAENLIRKIIRGVYARHFSAIDGDRKFVTDIFKRLATPAIMDTGNNSMNITSLELPESLAGVRAEIVRQISYYKGRVLNNCYFNYPARRTLKDAVGVTPLLDSRSAQIVVDLNNSMSRPSTEFCALLPPTGSFASSVLVVIDLNSDLQNFPTCKVNLKGIQQAHLRNFACQERSLEILSSLEFSQSHSLADLYKQYLSNNVRNFLLDNFKPLGRNFEQRRVRGLPHLCVRTSRWLERTKYEECGMSDSPEKPSL